MKRIGIAIVASSFLFMAVVAGLCVSVYGAATGEDGFIIASPLNKGDIGQESSIPREDGFIEWYSASRLIRGGLNQGNGDIPREDGFIEWY